MGKLAISEIVLLDEPSNKQRVTGEVADVFRWWVSTILESTKQWVDLKLMRAWNRILLRWSWLRIKGEVRETKSEWELERADALSWIRLVAVQGSSMQPSVCVEFWGLLSIFPRVSWRQLPEYQQLLKHCNIWKRPWSASWNRSLVCGFLYCNRGIDCFWDISYTCHWSTCYCWPAWKRSPPAECWVASWE